MTRNGPEFYPMGISSVRVPLPKNRLIG